MSPSPGLKATRSTSAVALLCALALLIVPSTAYSGLYFYRTLDVSYDGEENDLPAGRFRGWGHQEYAEMALHPNATWVEVRQFETQWEANLFSPASWIKGRLQGLEVENRAGPNAYRELF